MRKNIYRIFAVGVLVLSCIGPEDSLPVNVSLIVNEYAIDNTSFVDADSTLNGWVEILNYSDTAVPLAEYGIADNEDLSNYFMLEDSLIPPGGYYLLWSGHSIASPWNHTGFNFAGSRDKGEKIILFHRSGTVIDRVDYNALPDTKTGRSVGRTPDGSTRWILQRNASPGESNRG